MYHDNPVINDIMLTVINDGAGDQCGYSYKQRMGFARNFGLLEFRVMCKNYDRQRVIAGSASATRAEIIEAADRLFHYYQEHAKECQT